MASAGHDCEQLLLLDLHVDIKDQTMHISAKSRYVNRHRSALPRGFPLLPSNELHSSSKKVFSCFLHNKYTTPLSG
jgi:hypothetical protein